MRKENVLLLGVFFGIILGVCGAMIFEDNNFLNKKYKVNSYEDILDNCKNMDIIETSYCLRDNVKTFYKYNLTDDSIILSFEQIKNNGGDCLDFSRLYQNLNKDLGYDSDIIKFKMNETMNHAVLIVHNRESFCYMSQLNVNCINYGK